MLKSYWQFKKKTDFCKNMHDFCKTMHYFCKNMHGFCKNVHDFCKNMHDFCKNMHDLCKNVHAFCKNMYDLCKKMHGFSEKQNPQKDVEVIWAHMATLMMYFKNRRLPNCLKPCGKNCAPIRGKLTKWERCATTVARAIAVLPKWSMGLPQRRHEPPTQIGVETEGIRQHRATSYGIVRPPIHSRAITRGIVVVSGDWKLIPAWTYTRNLSG